MSSRLCLLLHDLVGDHVQQNEGNFARLRLIILVEHEYYISPQICSKKPQFLRFHQNA